MPRATTVLAVGLVIVSGMLAGCGGGSNPYALPKYDAADAGISQPRSTGSSASRSAKLSPAQTPPTPVKYQPADPFGEGAWVERGKIKAGSARQSAAVDAMAKYLSVWVQLSNTWQVDESALEAVASAQAVTNARQRAEQQRRQKRRSIGRFVINVSSVKVSGSSATVTGCDFDATSEVDQDGNVLVGPTGGVLIRMKLRRTGGTWRVIESPDHAVPICDWRS